MKSKNSGKTIQRILSPILFSGIFSGIILGISSPVIAQIEKSNSMKSSRLVERPFATTATKAVTSTRPKLFKDGDVRTEVKLFSDNFVSPSFDENSERSFQFLGVDFDTTRTPYLLQADLKGAYAVGTPLLSYINVSEAYLNLEPTNQDQFALGRKKINWSELDGRWNFALYEPVFRVNPLSPQRQGLSGLFWHRRDGRVDVTLFGSILYLPDQGPSFAINEKGEFERANPWFQRPPDSVRVMSEAVRAEYNFEKPNESEIVSQKSYAGKLGYEFSDNFSAQINHAYKPVNQLALGYDGYLDIPKNRVVVTIHPEVTYHQVTGLDLIYKFPLMKLGISAIYDEPFKEKKFSDNWTYPEFKPATILSPFVDIRVHRSLILSGQYLRLQGGEVIDKGPLASVNRPSISRHYSFNEAWQVAANILHPLPAGREVKGKISYTISPSNSFDILRGEASWTFVRQWRAFGDVQLVKADNAGLQNYSEYAQFDNHDRVSFGVGYEY